MMLGDLGADVIKIERPGAGDDTRAWGPPFAPNGESAYFLSVNRNKKSLAADFANPADRALVESLILDANVVVDNFRQGVLARHGLDPDRILERSPTLVWCSITGFGPDSDRPGYDFIVQAEQGWMAITGAEDGAPMKVGVALADVIAGKDAAVAVLGALVDRFRSGRGRRITTSLAQSATAALVNVAQSALVTGQEATRWGNAHPNLVPYELFEAEDRPLVIAVGNDAQWRACARALGLPDMAADERYATNAGRVTHRAEVVRVVAGRVRERPAAHWLARLEESGVPCGIVRGVLEVLEAAPASALTGVAPSVPGVVRFPPPRLDEHGDTIRRLGWSAFRSQAD